MHLEHQAVVPSCLLPADLQLTSHASILLNLMELHSCKRLRILPLPEV